MKTNKKTKQIYLESLDANTTTTAPKDTKQIINIRYQEKLKDNQKRHLKQNIADEVLDIISLIQDHTIVQQIIHSKSKVPSIICYTDK